MIGAQQRGAQVMEHIMAEPEIGQPCDFATALQHGQVSIKCDLAQNHHDLNVF